jgi:hypothetical protein
MAFVYMPDRQAAILFGGQGKSNSYLNDTWLWKAGCWAQLSPATKPPAMSNLTAAYDVSRSTLVLWGQHRVSPESVAETWLWNGLDWQKSAASGPQTYATATYDPTASRVFVLDAWMKTWTWNGSQWQEISSSHRPSDRYATSITFDPAAKAVILFGGVRGGSAGLVRQVLSDTWSWNGSDWVQLSPTSSPPAREDPTIVTFAAANKVLLFGGSNDSVLADAWAWDGKSWSPIISFGASNGTSAIDIGSKIVVFGGWTDGQYTSVTRSWDGTSWAIQ